MKISFLENKDAVSSVVTAILLLSVITTFIAAINSYYIPSLVADHEIHHMQDVRNSFMEIAASASPGSSKERVLVPLGDGGMPFLSSLSSSGTLTVSPDKGKIEITMEKAHPLPELVENIDDSSKSPVNDINSLSHLILKITDPTIDMNYIARVGSDSITASISSSEVKISSSKISDQIEIDLNGHDNVSLDLLDPAYGFSDVIDSQSSDFELSFSGMSKINYFDVGYCKTLTTSITPPTISSDGQLCYKSSNNQWIEQDYIFENGAVILNQGSNSTIKSQPFFNIDGKDIELCLFNITSTDASIGGNGVAVVNVFGSEGDEYEYRDVEVTTIKITSNYTEAWEDYFKRKGADSLNKDSNKWVKATFSNRNVSITTSDVDIVLPK